MRREIFVQLKYGPWVWFNDVGARRGMFITYSYDCDPGDEDNE